jgi:hypothetical protein
LADASDNQAIGGNRPQPDTLWDRVVRARGIAAERMREKPTTWPRIAKKFGISRAQAQAIYAGCQKWCLTTPDPLARVDERSAQEAARAYEDQKARALAG